MSGCRVLFQPSHDRGEKARSCRMEGDREANLHRHGPTSLLEGKPDLEIIGEAEDEQQALAQVEALQPDLSFIPT